MNNTAILEALNSRYATQAFDTTKTVSQEDLDTLIESLRLAPSAFNVQPWKFVIISDPALKEKLSPAAYGQPKVIQAPYLFVLCRRTDLDKEYVHSLADLIAQGRGTQVEQLAGFEQSVNGMLDGKNSEQLAAWSAKQVYTTLGFLLQTAALLGLDAGPMEGFDPKAFDEILGLAEQNLASCVIVSIGYRSPDDPTANAKRIRRPKENIVIMK